METYKRPDTSPIRLRKLSRSFSNQSNSGGGGGSSSSSLGTKKEKEKDKKDKKDKKSKHDADIELSSIVVTTYTEDGDEVAAATAGAASSDSEESPSATLLSVSRQMSKKIFKHKVSSSDGGSPRDNVKSPRSVPTPVDVYTEFVVPEPDLTQPFSAVVHSGGGGLMNSLGMGRKRPSTGQDDKLDTIIAQNAKLVQQVEVIWTLLRQDHDKVTNIYAELSTLQKQQEVLEEGESCLLCTLM